MKKCIICNIDKNNKDFLPTSSKKKSLKEICKLCRYAKRNVENIKWRNRFIIEHTTPILTLSPIDENIFQFIVEEQEFQNKCKSFYKYRAKTWQDSYYDN